jgi:XTP/dITP diphosphohydrolase
MEGNSKKNIGKLLKEMKGIANRKARFRTVIAFINDNGISTFEGIVNGIITHQESGNNGFGYDPVFIPEGSQKTFAEMSLTEKNKISHRSMALNRFIDHLNTFNPNLP